MPHGAHVFNGIIQINFQPIPQKLTDPLCVSARRPLVAVDKAPKGPSIWQLLNLFTGSTVF